jgi:hypothetical protein
MADHIPNLGEVPAEDARRDAVHIAVAPVIAGCNLQPGQRVGLHDGRLFAEGEHIEAIGIVDPFRTQPVASGERFWLFLFPGSITGLCHVWQHPAFRPKLPEREHS